MRTFTQAVCLYGFFSLVIALPGTLPAQNSTAEPPSLFTPAEIATYQPRGPSVCFRQLCYDYNWPGRTLADLPLKFTASDPVALAEFSRRCCVDAVLLLAVPHHGFTTYPSRAGTPFPALVGKDWYGACVKELHQRNISVFGYITLGTNWKFMRDNRGMPFIHSEVSPDGVVKDITGLCFNAPGYIDLVESYTREILTRYPLDAIRYDMLFGPKRCLCDGCKAYYKQVYGEELSNWAGVPDRRVMDFYLATLARPVNRLTQVARSIKPTVEIWQNHINTYSEADINLGRQHDIAYVEFGDPVRLLALRGILNKEGIIIGQTLTSPVRRQIMALSGRCYQYMPVDQQTTLPKDTKWFDNDLAPFFQMVRQVQPYLEATTLPTHIGIVFSENTRRRFPGFNREPYMAACSRIATDYLKSSIPVRFLNCLDLETTDLSKFKLLVLPGTSGLKPGELDRLRQFARAGGVLLLTGRALLADEQGEPLKDFAASRDMGVSFDHVETNALPGSAIQPGASWTFTNSLAGISISNLCLVRPASGTTLLQVKSDSLSAPLLQVSPLGEGRIAYLATEDSGRLTRVVMDMLAGPTPIQITPPEKQVVLARQEKQKRWILHLLNDGNCQIEIRADLASPKRISAKYPESGWNAELVQLPHGARVVVQGEAKDRLLVLE